MNRFQLNPGIAPQIDVVTKSSPANKIADRRPIRSANQPHAHDPTTVPVMPASGSQATGTWPAGLVADLRPYSAAMPGATKASVAGFMLSMMIAVDMTSRSARCRSRIGASSSARRRMPAAACRIRPEARGVSPYSAAGSPAMISAIPASIAASGCMPAIR